MIAHADLVSHTALVVVAAAAVWVAVTAGGGTRRVLAVVTGAVALVIVLSPPAETIAERSYTWHMVQHLVLVLLVGPCIAWGMPRWLPSRATRRHVGPAARRTIRSASHVVLAASFPVVLLATHLTAWYGAAVDHQLVHDVEHAAFVVSAIGLWWLVLGRPSVGAPIRIFAAFGTIVATAIVGIVLTTAGTPLVAAYERRLGTAAALTDQGRAGALMWTVGMAAAVPLLLVAFVRWARTEQRNRERLELLLDGVTDRSPVSG